MALFINVLENRSITVGYFCKIVTVVLVRVFPFEVKAEIFSSEVSERSLSFELNAVKFRKGGSESEVDFDHSCSFTIELLVDLCEERSFLFGFDVNNRYEINMIDILTSGLNGFHAFHVIFHNVVELLLISGPTEREDILFGLFDL